MTSWLDYVAEREREIITGDTEFIASHDLDAEALSWLTAEGSLPADAAEQLADAAQWLQPWSDTVEALDLLAADVTVVGLSNASRRALTGLSSLHDELRV